LKAPLQAKRRDIVIGTFEPTDADLPEKQVIALPAEGVPDTSKGIPEFWFQVFRNCSFVSEMITDNDEPAVKHLVDIRTTQEDSKGFTLEFEFSDNEFFTDKVLVKKYITTAGEYSDDSTFEKAEGTKINWKPGKDLTHRTIQKKGKAKKGRGRGATPTITVTEKVESFFNFFEPIEVPNEPVDEQEAEQLEQDMEIDFDIGREIKDRVVPHAVLWYTGEAALLFADDYDLEDDMFGYEDDDEGNGSEEEGESEEEHHHHGGGRGRGRGAGNTDEAPPKGSGGRGRGRGAKPPAGHQGAGVNEPPPQQCKQQ